MDMRTLILLLPLQACSLIPMASAGVGAGLGSLVGGPTGAFVGGAVGEAAGHVVASEELGVGSGGTDLTEELVQALVSSKMDEQKGFVSGLLDEFYALLKIAVIAVGIFVLAPLVYAWHRKRKAQPYYEWIEKQKNGD